MKAKPSPAADPTPAARSNPSQPPAQRPPSQQPGSNRSRLPNTVKGPVARGHSPGASQTSDRTPLRRNSSSPSPQDAPNHRRTRQRPYVEPEPEALDRPMTNKATRSANGKSSKSAGPSTSSPAPSTESTGEPKGKTKRSTAKSSKRQTTKSKRSAAASAPSSYAPPAPSGGYKVQVIAKIPVSNNTNLPGRDYLWFANYPIIPRVGDCLFQNGMYFRVDAVFLYENNRPGWCADVEVSYYARRR